MHDFAKAHFVHIICLTMQQKSLEKLVAVDHAMLYCTSTKYILLPKDEPSCLSLFGASLLLLQNTYQHVQSHCSTQYLLSGHFSLEGIKNYNFIEISSNSIQQVTLKLLLIHAPSHIRSPKLLSIFAEVAKSWDSLKMPPFWVALLRLFAFLKVWACSPNNTLLHFVDRVLLNRFLMLAWFICNRPILLC